MRICGSLSKAGYDVLLLGHKLSESPPLREMPFRQKRLSCIFNKGKLFYLEYNIRVFFFLLFCKTDHICAIDLDTLLPCFLASKIRTKTCIYDAHEYFTEVPEVITRPAVKKIWEALARFVIPKLKYCYTVGPELSKIFKEKYGVPFEVIRNVPIPTKTNYKYTKKEDEKILLYQGALNDGRGIAEILEVMPEIKGAVLWLAGEGDLSLFLRNKCKELHIENKVVFHGRVVPEELKRLTAQAHIGLNLLENKGLNYYYSLANKFFDYIQADVPSINMAFPEYKNLNEQYEVSLLIPNLEKAVLKKAIEELLYNEKLYNQLKSNCQPASKILNWNEEEKKLLEFYQRLPNLSNRNPNRTPAVK